MESKPIKVLLVEGDTNVADLLHQTLVEVKGTVVQEVLGKQ